MHEYDTPDSPFTESVDDWSSFAELNSDEDTSSFIMPRPESLQIVPARAPTVGKLRVLVLGGPNAGKTSLIKALPSVPSLGACRARHGAVTTMDFAPGWPTESAHAAADRTEPSVSFIDGATPDFISLKLCETAELVNGAHPMATALLSRAASLDPFPLVDCVVYLFEKDVNSIDIVHLQQICEHVPVIPIVSKCDCVPAVELFERRVALKRALENLQLQMFYFQGQTLPYAVSSNTTRNWDMSASVVESIGYQSQELVQSQLHELVDEMLAAANELRHHAALAFAQKSLQNALQGALQPPRRFVLPQYKLELSNALCIPATSVCNSTKMRPIRNIDPLDIGKWTQALGVLAALLTVGSVALRPTLVSAY